MIIVAHQDDDTLFMHHDLRRQLDAGGAMTTVFLTAGDAGLDETYWLGREAGARAAYGVMTGLDSWVNDSITLSLPGYSYQIATSYLAERPDVRLYFLRLPDGPGGRGTAAQGFQSLEKLWTEDLATLSSVDGLAALSRVDVLNVLVALMQQHQPDHLMIPDAFSQYAAGEHSDHRHAARFALLARQLYDKDMDVDAFIGYATRSLPANLPVEDYQRALDAFYAYALHDPRTMTGLQPDGTPIVFASYMQFLQRQHSLDGMTSYWLNGLSQNAGDWRVTTHVRQFADVNGDGRAEAVGFGTTAVMVARNNSLGFDELRSFSSEFTQRTGWRVPQHERALADVDGDGRADVVGFGDQGVFVALSNGTGFAPQSQWSADFGRLSAGWRVGTHERALADVNGDGMADVVGFGAAGIRVALSTGTGFATGALWTNQALFAARNIDPARHERAVADVNGDGRADVVGFGHAGVLVALSNGAGFDDARLWIANFGHVAGGWRVGTHERLLADVNGDGRADVVGFGHAGVLVALSNGTGFDRATRWTTEDAFRAANWDATRHIRDVADVNGDGMADLIWVDDHGIRVSLSNGAGFYTPSFDQLIADAFVF